MPRKRPWVEKNCDRLVWVVASFQGCCEFDEFIDLHVGLLIITKRQMINCHMQADREPVAVLCLLNNLNTCLL